MLKRIGRLLIIPFILSVGVSYGQMVSVVDSLVKALETPMPDTSKALLYDNLARYILNTNATAAMKYAKLGLALAEKSKYDLGRARLTNRIGTILRSNGNYAEALKLYYDSNEIATRIGDEEGIAKTLNSIGILYGEQKDYQNSIQNYKKAQAIAEKIGNKRIVGITILNSATDYAHLGLLDSALLYNEMAYEIAEETEKTDFDVILTNIGNIKYQQGKFLEALDYFRRSESFSKDLKNNLLLAQTYLKMALVFDALNQRDSSIYYAKESLKFSELSNNLDYLNQSAEYLSRMYEDSKPTESLMYYKRAIAARDSLTNIDKIVQIHQIEFNEEMRKQELEVARLAAKTKQKMGLLVGLLIGFVLLGAVIYRNYLQKAQTNKLLLVQNEEIKSRRNELEISLSQLKNTQNQLIQSEKLASMGELTAGIAHEIQNPMNFVNNFAEVGLELVEEINQELEKSGCSDKEKKEILSLTAELNTSQQKILMNGKRASSIVRGMLEHSRGKSGERSAIDINNLCDEYLRLSYHGMRAKDTQFNAAYELDLYPNLPLYEGVSQDLSRVILNLINNAFYAVNKRRKEEGEGYEPNVVLHTGFEKGKSFEIKISDNGGGISKENLEKIFQPFFTTKPTGDGTGLGLSISYDIITNGNNGTLSVESEVGKGSTFTIKLPVEPFENEKNV